MFINNLDSVVKIFFRGLKVIKVKQPKAGSSHPKVIEQSLTVLEKKGIIQTRVRHDTKIK